MAASFIGFKHSDMLGQRSVKSHYLIEAVSSLICLQLVVLLCSLNAVVPAGHALGEGGRNAAPLG